MSTPPPDFVVLDNYYGILHHVDMSSGQLAGEIRLTAEDGTPMFEVEDSDNWTGLCVHRSRVSGELFAAITDTACHVVYVFDMQSGKKVRSIGEGHHCDPDFLCVHCPPDAPALLLVSEGNYNCIKAFDWESGAYMYSIGKGPGKGPGQLRGPSGTVLWTPQNDPADAQLVVADMPNHRLQVFRLSDGEFLRTIGEGVPGSTLYHPHTLALHLPAGGRDEDALIIVVGNNNDNICVYNLVSGEYVRTISDIRGVTESDSYCYGMAVHQPPGQPDTDTQLIVSDSDNSRLQVYHLHSGAHLYDICRSDTSSLAGLCRMPPSDDAWDYVLK